MVAVMDDSSGISLFKAGQPHRLSGVELSALVFSGLKMISLALACCNRVVSENICIFVLYSFLHLNLSQLPPVV